MTTFDLIFWVYTPIAGTAILYKLYKFYFACIYLYKTVWLPKPKEGHGQGGTTMAL